MLAIIGGSGLTQMPIVAVRHRRVVRTPYGEPSAPLTFGELDGHEVVFLARHGSGHSIPPHEINYRANIWALRESQAQNIVSLATVGGIRPDLGPGEIAIPHQIIDYTWGRRQTYFDSGAPVKHVDFTNPYDESLRARLIASSVTSGVQVSKKAVYAATQGPRLETAAEISKLERDGADIVGMTAMPETALARELAMPYASIAMVANWAAGKRDSAREIDLSMIERIIADALNKALLIIRQLLNQPR